MKTTGRGKIENEQPPCPGSRCAVLEAREQGLRSSCHNKELVLKHTGGLHLRESKKGTGRNFQKTILGKP